MSKIPQTPLGRLIDEGALEAYKVPTIRQQFDEQIARKAAEFVLPVISVEERDGNVFTVIKEGATPKHIATVKWFQKLELATGEGLDIIGAALIPPMGRYITAFGHLEPDHLYRDRLLWAKRNSDLGVISANPDEAPAPKETMTQRALRKMMTPRKDPDLDEALKTIEIQRQTIELYRAHFRDLNESIAKLEAEIDGLMSLI